MRDRLDTGKPQTTTDWSRHDTPSMWRMLEPQQTDPHWRHATGLRKLTELTATHMARLQVYRDELARAWPPEKSPASRAFISRLDYLIAHVRTTHEVAATNYTALTTATTTLDTARMKVAALHAEYAEKLQARKTYDALVASTKASQLPGTTIGPPPVSDADLERINMTAREVMSDLSHALTQARFRRPAPYKPPEARSDSAQLAGIPESLIVSAITALSPPAPRRTAHGARPSMDHLPGQQGQGTFAKPKATPTPSGPATSLAPRHGRSEASRFPGTRAGTPVRAAAPIHGGGESQGVTSARSSRPAQGVIAPAAGLHPTSHSMHPAAMRGQGQGQAGVIAPPLQAHPAPRLDSNARAAGFPDHTWDVPDGVPAVIVPPAPHEIDPGPAIGLTP